MNQLSEPLILPGLRAHMGDWIYYITFMKMRDIADRISVAQNIHSSRTLRDLLQRQLTKRSSEIRDYLIERPQRFFNALVVGTYGGNPQWHELSLRQSKSSPLPVPDVEEGVLGILTLEGSEAFFAIDGQHRVVGIKEAVQKDPDLGDEEVCVIFVPGVTASHREDDPAGFERTRRLFTTLNRYAKPVNKRDIIALDEDDVIAIVTRQLVEEYDLFKAGVSVKQSRSIPISDKRSLTTIVTLYDANDAFLRDRVRGWTTFKKSRPSDDVIQDHFDRSVQLWDALVEVFGPLREYKNSPITDDMAKPFRNDRGGHLLFRPVGFLLVVRTIRHHCDDGVPLKEAASRVAKVPMELSKDPWVGLLWDQGNRRMVTTSENQKAAEKLLYYSSSGDLSRYKSSTTDLKKELGGILNKEAHSINLNIYE